MAQDFGIIITQPGIGVLGAQPAQLTMNTTNPFIKIDTQNKAGFQTLLLLITTDPPEPGVGGTNYTTLYSFNHGYNYIPSVETLFYVSTPPPSPYNGFTQTYFTDYGVLGGATSGAGANLYAVADKTKVYIICSKWNVDGTTTLLTGTNVQITTHVFVEDIGV